MAEHGDGKPGVVITGMGAVTPIGVGVNAYIRSVRAGRSGVRPLAWTHPLVKSTVAAEVGPDLFDPRSVMTEADTRRLPRLVPMALAAATEAVRQAGIGCDASERGVGERAGVELPGAVERSRRTGLVLGTGAGGIDFTLDQFSAAHAGGHASLWTITNATHGNLGGELSIRLGLRGPSWCVSTGCASASDAVGMALRELRTGDDGGGGGVLDAVVVIGADAHVRWEVLHTMELLKVISTRDWRNSNEDPASASRPFDRTRDGFVLGEGAWAVVLERAGAAARRGARVIGEVLGYGATCDAYHRVRPAPDMEESARAMRLAIDDAGLDPTDVEVLHYHGTSTQLNDAAETRAVKLAFGDHARSVKGHSVKSMIGHPQGACGLASLVCTVGALVNADGGEGGFLPPTVHLSERDPACDLDYTVGGGVTVERRERVALINCLAFGAKNSALVVKTHAI